MTNFDSKNCNRELPNIVERADLDNYIANLKPGEVFVLAGRPATGKTTLILNAISNMILCNVDSSRIVFFSLGMNSGQIIRRFRSLNEQVPEKAQIFFETPGKLSLTQLQTKSRELKKQNNIGLIVIDYLQLIRFEEHFKTENYLQEMAKMTDGIKKLAEDLMIPIIVLAQLNRSFFDPMSQVETLVPAADAVTILSKSE